MNSQPLDPNTADSAADGLTSAAGRHPAAPSVQSRPGVASAAGQPDAITEAGHPSVVAGEVALAPKPGIRTTQFWLLAGVLALVAWMVFAGRLDAAWFAALAPIAALVYQGVRENLYRDASTHPHDAFNQLLETILGHLPAPTSADATALIAALKSGAAAGPVGDAVSVPDREAPGGEAASFPSTAAGTLTTSPTGPQTVGKLAASPTATATTSVAAILLALLLPLLPGCAQTPYYVSGINGTVDTSKDGARLTGGEVGVTISPNPDYPPPHSPSSGPANTTGFAK